MQSTRSLNDLTPARLVARLDQRIIGQATAKEKLAGALWWNNYRRVLALGGIDAKTLPPKQNVLLAGPTGTGKTLLARTAAELFDVPFFVTSATSYSSAGYVGLNPEDMIQGLLQAAGGDVTRAEGGIVFLDEVDKLRTRDFGGQDDVGGKAVQQALLAFIEGTTALLKKGDDRQQVNTANITFIAAGAFAGLDEVVQRRLLKGYDIEDADPLSEEDFRHLTADDLIDYGLIPEFVARFPVRAGLVPLSREQLLRLLREGEVSPLVQAVNLFRLHGIELKVEEEAQEALVDLALEEGTGARALMEVMLDRLLHVINALPQMLEQGLCRVLIDVDTVLRGSAPWKIAGDPVCEPLDLEKLQERARQEPVTLKPGISNPSGWSDAQIRERLEGVRKQLDWESTTGSARKWWEAFEKENQHRMSLVLRLAEELLLRKASITEFFLAYVYSNTDNIQANLHYLDYTRLKKEEERKKREATAKAREAEVRFRTGDTCPASARGRYQFDGYVEGPSAAPASGDRLVTLESGETFPPAASGRACWWKRAG